MHHDSHTVAGQRAGLEVPMRNHYFYGQLLSVQNFTLESGYFIRHRRLLNRLVLGYGVVCGLNVEVSRDGARVIIGPGLAIDSWGREIVVSRRSEPITIPVDVIRRAIERAGECDDACVQVVICYHECQGDPAPILAGDCGSAEPCTPSTIREQYRIEFRDECPSKPAPACRIPNLIANGRLDYDELAKWVTFGRNCARLPADPCIPLANLKVIVDDNTPRCDPNGIDIAARPILASNIVLMELILALLGREAQHSHYE
jgi:hypothetical protein